MCNVRALFEFLFEHTVKQSWENGEILNSEWVFDYIKELLLNCFRYDNNIVTTFSKKYLSFRSKY